MDDLVQRLLKAKQPVTVGGPKPSLEEFKRYIEDIGYVFIKFTDTCGGTDLGMQVDSSSTDLSQGRFDQRTGVAHVEGTLTLNYVNVRCIADIELETLNGTGCLVVLEGGQGSTSQTREEVTLVSSPFLGRDRIPVR